MAKVLIDKDKPLNPGDRIELHFVSSGMAWIKAVQIVLLEQKFSGRKDFEIIGWETPVEQPTLLIMRAEIKSDRMQAGPELQTAGVMTAAVIAAGVMGSMIVGYLTFKACYLIVSEDVKAAFKSTEGKIAVAGTGIGLAAAGIAALILIFLPKN